MLTHVEFRSDLFPPYEGEEEQINPGRFGKRLAEFIQRGLCAKGFKAEEPGAEDWGWIVAIQNDAFPLWIGCGNYDEYPDDGFLCFIEPHTPSIRKLFRKLDISATLEQLRTAIDDLLSAEKGIREKRCRVGTADLPFPSLAMKMMGGAHPTFLQDFLVQSFTASSSVRKIFARSGI
jgi:hypothetical protein